MDQGFLTIAPPTRLPLLEALHTPRLSVGAAPLDGGRAPCRARAVEAEAVVGSAALADAPDEWLAVEAALGTADLLVYAGKALEYASSGAIRAAMHRVRAPPPGSERFSAPFFCRPGNEVRLPPPPNSAPVPIRAADYLACTVAARARAIDVAPEEMVRRVRLRTLFGGAVDGTHDRLDIPLT